MLTGGGERSVAAPRTWPDGYLEHWGEYFVNHPEILARGVRFETFLFAPVEILRALRAPQIRVDVHAGTFFFSVERARRAAEQLGARCSNGALIEKLRHNRNRRDRNKRHGTARLV